MILHALESFVVVSTLLAVVSFAVAFSIRLATQLGWRLAPGVLGGMYSAAIVVPPVVTAWIVLAAFLPAAWVDTAAFAAAHGGDDTAHLLGLLTAPFEPVVGLVVVLAGLAVAASGVASVIVTYRRGKKLIRSFGAEPPASHIERAAGLVAKARAPRCRILLARTDYPLAFVWGYKWPTLVLSSGVFNALSPDQLQGVVAHEVAHCERQDNIISLVLTLGAHATLAASLSRVILRWRHEQVELVCDEIASGRATPLDTAEALVKLSRCALGVRERALAGISGFLARDSSRLEQRVRRLVALSHPERRRRQATHPLYRRTTVLVAVLVFAASLGVVVHRAPLAIHVAAESLIRILP